MNGNVSTVTPCRFDLRNGPVGPTHLTHIEVDGVAGGIRWQRSMEHEGKMCNSVVKFRSTCPVPGHNRVELRKFTKRQVLQILETDKVESGRCDRPHPVGKLNQRDVLASNPDFGVV